MLSQLDIQNFTDEQCEEALEQLEREYDFDKCITDSWTQEIDHVINCILWIEDRQQYLMFLANGEKGAAGRLESLARKRQGIEFKGIMTPKGRVDDVKAAAALMGFTQQTIRTYLVNRKEEYFRCP